MQRREWICRHLWPRGRDFSQECRFACIGVANQPCVGDRPQLGRPWRFSQFKVPTPAPGPRLGEANDYVLKEVLGLSDAEVAAMAEEAVIGSTPVGGRVPNPVPAEEQLRLGRVVLLDREYRKRLGLD